MRGRKALLFLLPVVIVLLSLPAGRSSANGHRAGLFGKPLEDISMQQRKAFRAGKDAFEETETAARGLGPIFNSTSCVACHSVPVVGGSNPLVETRAARVTNGQYIELAGGSLFQANAIRPDCAETVPAIANVVAARQTTPLFGLGLVEAIPDFEIEGYASRQCAFHPGQAGRVNHVVDVASGQNRVGRFGWKAQQATLLAFSGDAYLNEIGITNRLFPTENAPNGDLLKLRRCDAVADPEDTADDITHFTNFMRFLAPPPREDDHDGDRDKDKDFDRDGHDFDKDEHGADDNDSHGSDVRGRRLFSKVGCAVCHHGSFKAVSPFDAINGRRVAAFSDFLLHDVGTGDGIIQGNARGTEFRTPPLWGISQSAPYLHDGSAATIQDAIQRHGNQGASARDAFGALSFMEQQALLAFLDSI
jgi:CxxC motif-containing protein (DUF1111 family)